MKALKLNISQKYRKDMLPDELYEAARRAWSPSEENRDTVQYALIVAKDKEDKNKDPRGEVRALYEIESWEPVEDEKWCFSGKPADAELWDKCIGEKQAGRKNSQNPLAVIDLRVFMEFGHGINKPHVENALDYIVEKGKSQNDDILYVSDKKKPHKAYILHAGKKCGVKDIMRIAYCYSINEVPNDQNGEFSQKQCGLFDHTSARWNTNKARKFLKNLGFNTDNDNSKNQSGESDMKTTELRELLEQFYQIILYGPPGTGKTYSAKQVLMELLNVKDEKALDNLRDYWDIVQFHPSYNYEDFVRGIKVNTKGGQPTYDTVNRVFGDMCKSAQKNKRNHVLIIDEINRANVSAVLGELIYALEYRNKRIKTPYLGDIIIPENLYIIGTMNTADRTIGQIDYAVRRRFALVHCLPNEDIISDDKAKEFFFSVDKIVKEHLSSGFDADDFRIGHSYFMTTGKKLSNRIIYQVVPILREYVKDGVLKETAKDLIGKILDKARNSTNDIPKDNGEEEDTDDNDDSGGRRFYWEKDDRSGSAGVGRTAFNIIKDFITHHPEMTANELSEKFEKVSWRNHKRIKLLPNNAKDAQHYFTDIIPLKNGNETVCISSEWGATGQSSERWNEFKNYMKQLGYSISQYRIVNIDNGDMRLWEYCAKYDFVSAGGKQIYHTQLNKIQEGDILFICLLNGPQTGCIACARVISEVMNVWEIPVETGELGDVLIDEKTTYREKFCDGKDFPDKAVKIEWFSRPPLDNPIQRIGWHRKFRTDKINIDSFKRLTNAFNIKRDDSDE